MQSYNLQRWQGPLGRGARESRDSMSRWSTVLARVLFSDVDQSSSSGVIIIS